MHSEHAIDWGGRGFLRRERPAGRQVDPPGTADPSRWELTDGGHSSDSRRALAEAPRGLSDIDQRRRRSVLDCREVRSDVGELRAHRISDS
jgi:hypothetical protein